MGDKGGVAEAEAIADRHAMVYDKKAEVLDAAETKVSDLVEGEEVPTVEEVHNLRKVADRIPFRAFLVVVVELCERYSYYGTTGPLTNYIQQPLPPGSKSGSTPKGFLGPAGALGQGQRTATALMTFLSFWCYVTPVLGAILADVKWGRFKAIVIFTYVCLIGHIILTLTSIPQALETPKGALGGLAVALVIMGLGTGGIKANVSPLVAEQYQKGMATKKVLKSGETVIVDPSLTVQKIYLYFYFCINVGSLAGISTIYSEKYVGFWLAFALPTIAFFFVPWLLHGFSKHYVKTAPRGSILLDACRVFRTSARGRWSLNPLATYRNFKTGDFWSAAKPSSFLAGGAKGESERPQWLTWDDEFVDELARALRACKVFLFMPLYWLAYNQQTNNLVSQAAAMRLNGTPNDLIQNLNPISLIIMIPIMDQIVYPTLRKFKIRFTPIRRITCGFMAASAAMVYSAVIQSRVYALSPCGDRAATCTDQDDQVLTADLNVWLQAPSYLLIGLSEIFASITTLEYAYTKAPARMRSVVMAVNLFMNAIASALGFALTSVANDPYLVGNYTGIACAAFVAGLAFFFTFRRLDREEEELNQIGKGKREGFVDEKQ